MTRTDKLIGAQANKPLPLSDKLGLTFVALIWLFNPVGGVIPALLAVWR